MQINKAFYTKYKNNILIIYNVMMNKGPQLILIFKLKWYTKFSSEVFEMF